MVLYEIYREDGGNGITFVHMMYIVTYSGMLVLEGKIQLWYKAFHFLKKTKQLHHCASTPVLLIRSILDMPLYCII
jgi:hypothetical protein